MKTFIITTIFVSISLISTAQTLDSKKTNVSYTNERQRNPAIKAENKEVIGNPTNERQRNPEIKAGNKEVNGNHTNEMQRNPALNKADDNN